MVSQGRRRRRLIAVLTCVRVSWLIYGKCSELYLLGRRKKTNVCCYYYHYFHFTDGEVEAPMCVHAKLLQSYPTLCDPMDCGLLGSSVHGFSRQEYWSGLPCPSPADLPNPGITFTSLKSPALAGGFFTTTATTHRDIQLCIRTPSGGRLNQDSTPDTESGAQTLTP